MQNEKADDFVLATGETHSVREFIEKTFKYVGIEIGWRGAGENEIGVIASIDKESLSDITQISEQFVKEDQTVVRINPSYFRPTEVDLLIGDASKAQKVLGWKAQTKFEDLIKIMVDADILFIKNPSLDY